MKPTLILNCRDIIDKRRELWQQDHDIEGDKNYCEAVAVALTEDNEQGAVLRKEIQEHPEYLIEMVFKLVDKNQETVPFFLNTVQNDFLSIINRDMQLYRQGKLHHLMYLVLKGRQQGFTTFITAYQLARTITRSNFSGMTVADSSDNTTTIFEDKAKFPYSLLPEPIKPTEQYNTRQELHFANLNSKWRIATAGNKEIGRSKTVNFFHGSEAAFWPSIQNIMGGLGQALTKDSIQILESTANGFNEYRKLWVDAENKENNWQPLFFEWWRTPEYTLTFEDEEREQAFLSRLASPFTEFDKKLKWLQEEKGLSLEQLYWYDGKEKDLKSLLPQEYPCTPLEAFISSGLPVFDVQKVLERKDQVDAWLRENRPRAGYFKYEYVNQMIIEDSITFVEDINGPLKIYKEPEIGHYYTIGCDTAEGGEDYNVGQVLDCSTGGNQVAKYKERTDTDLFAKQMYCLGMYYNRALIGFEVNFDSHPVKELERLRYLYQYMRETMDTITGQIQKKYGWNTSPATRPILIGDLVEIVRDETHLICDADTLNEMLVFQRIKGKPQAAEGEHDDCVLALAIAFKIRSQQRNEIKIPNRQLNELEKHKNMMAKRFKNPNKKMRRVLS